MKLKRDKIFIVVSILSLLILGLLLSKYIKHTKNMYTSSLKELYNIVLKVKEDNLKEIVDGVVNGINSKINKKTEESISIIEETKKLLEKGISYEELFNSYNYYDKNLNSNNIMPYIKYVIINRENNQVIKSCIDEFVVGNITSDNELNEYNKKNKFSTKHKESNIDIIISIEEKDIEQLVKDEILYEIRNKTFSKGRYIWIDEIIDFNGGDNYAKRIVYPSIQAGEEVMISTNTQDSKGNFFYKEILEDINKNGESLIFHYFGQNDSQDESKKLSYIKLYPKFNWTIGTGVFVDELEAYIHSNKNELEEQLKQLILIRIGVTVLMLIIATIMWWGIFNYFEYKKRELRKQEYDIIKTHYKLLENKYDKSNSIIHDIKNHLISIYGLAVKDNANEIREYVKSIQSDISQLGYIVITGNKILDIILSEKIYIMKNNNIEFKYNIEKLSLDFIELKDIATIFTNLLDNSIESCIESINKEIGLYIYTFNNSFIVIKLINSCDKEPNIKNNIIKTKKKNKNYHGYGLNNVSNVVEEYSGNIKWSYLKDKREFHTVIMIPYQHLK